MRLGVSSLLSRKSQKLLEYGLHVGELLVHFGSSTVQLVCKKESILQWPVGTQKEVARRLLLGVTVAFIF